MAKELKRNVKATLFESLFNNKKYLLDFYKDMNPTSKNISEEDIKIVDLSTDLVKGLQNDICFYIGFISIVIMEAQSTFNSNVILRCLGYACEEFANYVKRQGKNVFKAKPIPYPKLQIYLVSTGKIPEELKDFYVKVEVWPETFFEIEFKVIDQRTAKGIMAQYIEFTEILHQFLNHDERFNNDLTKFYYYCIEHNILSEYLINHRNEVLSMLRDFYTEEMRQEAEREDLEELIRKETTEKVRKETAEKVRKETAEKNNRIIKNLFNKGLSINDISDSFDIQPDEVKLILES